MSRRGVIRAAVLTVAAAGLIGGSLRYRWSRRAPWVEVVGVTREDVVQTVTATTAAIQPRQEIVVGADRSGRVAELRAHLGQAIRRGGVLAVVADPVLNAEAAQAELDTGRTNRNLERARALRSQGFIPAAELEAAAYDYNSSLARMRTLRERQRQLVIRTPISGTVTAEHVRAGEMLGGSADGQLRTVAFPIVTVATMGDLVARAYIDEADIPKVHPGQEALVTIEALDARVLQGVVERVAPAPSVNTAGSTYEVIITLRGARDLGVAGLTADVRVVVGRAAGVVSAPKEAVYPCRGGGRCVFVLGGDRAASRPVETGISDASQVEIRRGLVVGERVIVGFPQDLRDGERVAVRAGRR